MSVFEKLLFACDAAYWAVVVDMYQSMNGLGNVPSVNLTKGADVVAGCHFSGVAVFRCGYRHGYRPERHHSS